jgi:hypothetical protein
MSDSYGVKEKPITSHNKPLRSKCNHWASTKSCQWHSQIIWLEKNHENIEEQKDNPFDYFFQSNAWAIRDTYHIALHKIPYQLEFGRDIIHSVDFRENGFWMQIR